MCEAIDRDVERLHELLLAFDSRDKAIRPGLERISALCEALDQPQQSFPAVHVAGTNGKGSVVNFVSSALQANGLRVGIYTSPHLHHWNERITINGVEISTISFIEKVEQLFDIAKAANATVFELVTAIAFAHFAERQVDIAVIEVGLGGRFDATNLVNPIVTALTSVSVDHTNYLGTDVEKIAWEKVGIAKQGVPMVSAELDAELQEVVEDECEVIGAPLTWTKPLKQTSVSLEGQTFDSAWGALSLKALGVYQGQNLSTALAVLDELALHFQLDQTRLRTGIEQVQWPGRMEITQRDPIWILDGAHNPSGASMLRRTLASVIEPTQPSRRWLLFGVRADKDIQGIADELFGWFDHIVFTSLPQTAGLEPDALHKYAQQHKVESVALDDLDEALVYLDEQAGKDDVVCVAGSLVLVGEVRWRRLTEQH